MKTGNVLALSLLLGFSAQASSETLHTYPSTSKTDQLIEDGVEEILIESEFYADDRDRFVARIGYPSNRNTDNLNRLEDSDVSVRIDVSAYPSTRSQKYLSRLDGHVTISLKIRNCLSSKREKKRLLGIKRPATIRIKECITDRQRERAEEYAAEIMEESEDLIVTIL